MWLAWLLDAVAPPRCGGCADAGAAGLCRSCAACVESLGTPPPRRVGAALAHSAFPYQWPVRSAVVAGKRRSGRGALVALATLAAERLAPLVKPGDLLVPVPLSDLRGVERGFNQAAVVAGVVADLTPGRVVPGLRRRRHTAQQVGRSAADRHRNVEGAFTWTGPSLAGATAWLVDDVLTSGATLAAAAAALASAGAPTVGGLALAEAIGGGDPGLARTFWIDRAPSL